MTIKVILVDPKEISNKFNAVFRSYPIPFMKPKILLTNTDPKILVHELVHYKQWKANYLHTLLSTFSRKYKLKTEAEAYVYMHKNNIKSYRSSVLSIVSSYKFKYSKLEALEAIEEASKHYDYEVYTLLLKEAKKSLQSLRSIGDVIQVNL